MGQGKSKERYQKAVKKLSSLELHNIEAVFQELSTKTEDGTRRVELSLLTRQDFAERFHMTGFVAERLFHAFDKTEVWLTFTGECLFIYSFIFLFFYFFILIKDRSFLT